MQGKPVQHTFVFVPRKSKNTTLVVSSMTCFPHESDEFILIINLSKINLFSNSTKDIQNRQ